MLKKAAAAAVFATLSASSFAAETGPAYAGLDLGSTRIDGFPDHKTSFGGFLGYRFHENFAVEASLRRLGSWNIAGCDVKVDQAALSLIGTLPLSQQFNIYGRLGYNHLRARASYANFNLWDSTSGTLYGVGAGFDFAPNASARIEVQKPASDTTNVSVGVLFRF